MNITKLHIREPFWTAGKKYNWEGNTAGLGIALEYFKGYDLDILEVTVGEEDTIWCIAKSKARALAKRYNSRYNARGTILYVLPWNEFVRKDAPKLSETKEEIEQNTLF